MKFFWFLAVFVLANSLKLEVIVDSQVENVVFHAIKSMLEEHFTPNEPKVDFCFNGSNSAALAELLVRKKPFDLTFRMINLDLVEDFEVDSPSIFLFDSVQHYYSAETKISWFNKDFMYYNHLIYVAKKDGEIDIHVYFAQQEFGIENQNFLSVVNETTVDLITNFRFIPGKCNSPQYKTINRFTTDTMKWQNKTFFPEKYENFHGCPLRVGFDSENTTTSQMVVENLAKHLNFRMVKVQFDDYNNTLESMDLFGVFAFQHILLTSLFRFSSSLFVDVMTFTVPAGEPYTQLEKMFLMFDKATWICIGVTLGAAVLVIQFINFMSIKVQKFVFGRDVQTPTLNVSSIFLNGAQHRVPGRNFARYMLMMFIMWSLIIRTCYQSELYKNLQSDMRKPRIRTVDELNEQKFTLHEGELDGFFFKHSAERIKLWSNFTKLFDENSLAQYENKMTMLTYRKQKEAEFFHRVNQQSSIYFLDEDTTTVHYCMIFQKTSPMSSTLKRTVDHLISSGIIAKQEEDRTFVPKQVEKFRPEMLTMEHLGICFLAIMISLGCSCIIFIVECTFRSFVNGVSWLRSAQTIRNPKRSIGVSVTV